MASPCGLRASAVGHDTGGGDVDEAADTATEAAADTVEGGGATGAVLGTGRRAWSAKESASHITTQPSFITPTMRSSPLLSAPAPTPGV